MTALQRWLASQYKKGNTTRDIATTLGVARITVKSWSCGQRFPGEPIMTKLHALTGIDCRKLRKRA